MRSGSALTGPAGRPLLGPPCAARAGPSWRPRADGCSNIRVNYDPNPQDEETGKPRFETTPFLCPKGLISCLPPYPAFLCSSPTSQKPEITTLYPGLATTAKRSLPWLQSEE
ncbi:hypothetical protein U0070_011598 [Myodes glareolus]|uniref:Uncharacterized protein n=1 Tax=Myodes glareolus TaxID=447135 RepID=A0AAW0HNH0_MYOGA